MNSHIVVSNAGDKPDSLATSNGRHDDDMPPLLASGDTGSFADKALATALKSTEEEIVAREDDEEENDDDWIEQISDSEEGGSVQCLCCDKIMRGDDPSALLTHLRVDHSWDLLELIRQEFIRDTYDWIRFINYIRTNKCTLPSEVFQDPNWRQDSYLKPVLIDDALLCLDVDEMRCEVGLQPVEEDEDDADTAPFASSQPVRKVKALEEKVEDLQKTVIGMRQLMRRLVEEGDASSSTNGDSGQASSRMGPVGKLTANEDGLYFESYSHINIHAEMLGDRVRTEAYQNFILANGDYLFKGKRVLDVGCGTGILSMFAAKAGAQHVIGVDCADVIYQAMDIVRENQLEKQITLIKGKLEEIEIPGGKVDIIISEWMGYCLIYESMLDSVLHARDTLLSLSTNPTACLYPRIFTLHALACADSNLRTKNLDFWYDVYGFKMSCMRPAAMEEALVTVVPPESVVTQPALVTCIDVMSITVEDLVKPITKRLLMKVEKDAEITCLLLYFDTDFEPNAEHKVSFSTSPFHQSTHWKQTVLLLDSIVTVKKDDILECDIEIRRHRKNVRGLEFILKMGPNSQKFSMS